MNPVTEVDRKILELLKSRGPMSYVEIKRATGLHRALLYESLTKLRALGLIDFELRGIRTKVYYLTEAGRAAEGKAVEAVPRKKKVDVEVLVSVMTPSDARALRVMTLRKIPMSFSDIQKAAGFKTETQTRLAIRRLLSYGLIEAERKERKLIYRLTEEGESLAGKLVEAIEAKQEAYRLVESVLDKVLKVIRMGIPAGEIYRELRLYELERKKRGVS